MRSPLPPPTARDLDRRAKRFASFRQPLLVLITVAGLVGATLASQLAPSPTLASTSSGLALDAGGPDAEMRPVQQATCVLLDCCKPMVLKVEATAHSLEDPDPLNDPNIIDIAWRDANDNANSTVAVPIRFELVYCNNHSQGTTCHTYEGFVEISDTGDPVIMKDPSGTAWPDPGNCGSQLTSPFTSATEIIEFASWIGDPHVNTPIALCGTDVATDDFTSCASFAATEYYLWIARTASTGFAQPIQCFKYIKVWVDGGQSEGGVVIQHNYDSNDTCPGDTPGVSDEYNWVSSPQTTVTYAHFDTQDCQEPDVNFPGGQEVQICIFANFEPN